MDFKQEKLSTMGMTSETSDGKQINEHLDFQTGIMTCYVDGEAVASYHVYLDHNKKNVYDVISGITYEDWLDIKWS